VDDLTAINDIYTHYVLETHVTFDLEPMEMTARREWFSHYSDTGPHRLFVGEEDGRLIGFASSSPFKSRPGYATSVETSIYLEPEAVGKGAGARLYEELFDAIEGEDLHRAYAASRSRIRPRSACTSGSGSSAWPCSQSRAGSSASTGTWRGSKSHSRSEPEPARAELTRARIIFVVYSIWNMSETEPEISPLALSILQLLDERPMHPYELASTMRNRHQDEFIRLNFGSLYHTVESLERNGWIVPAEREREGGRPERTIYRLTKTGREVLVRVVGDILAHPRHEYPHFAAGLMFMHHLGAAEAASHLANRALGLKATTEKLSRIVAELRAEGLSRLALIELEHKIAMLDSERRWVSNLEREIREGKLEWRVGNDPDLVALRRRHGSRTH